MTETEEGSSGRPRKDRREDRGRIVGKTVEKTEDPRLKGFLYGLLTTPKEESELLESPGKTK